MPNDNDASIVCIICKSSQVEFSNRQRKRGNAAKCVECCKQLALQHQQQQQKESSKKGRDRNKRRKLHHHHVTTEDTMLEDENDAQQYDTTTSVSIQAIKRKILGRDLSQDTPTHSLWHDLSCVICHELLYDAIALSCGHSHCQQCWLWWGKPHCPTCRAPTAETDDVTPNYALQSALAALFPHPMADRRNGLEAGESSLGEQVVIVPIQEHDWVTHEIVRVRRSICSDATDARLVYGLAVRDTLSYDDGTNTIQITICRLHMEQDEAAEGMPVVVGENDDDECWMVENDDTMIGLFDATGPLQRVAMGHVLSLSLDTTYSIRHERTGCELQIQRALHNLHHSIPRRVEHHSKSLIHDDYGSEEDELEEEEEEDGFLVDESNCVLCNDGGELLVCDGGDYGGCARSFHIECIGRTKIPDGDWICQECANTQIGKSVGTEGYEFPVTDEEDGVHNEARDGGEEEDDDVAPEPQFSGNEEEEDDDDDIGLRSNAMYKKKRKAILIDSDDEEDSD